MVVWSGLTVLGLLVVYCIHRISQLRDERNSLRARLNLLRVPLTACRQSRHEWDRLASGLRKWWVGERRRGARVQGSHWSVNRNDDNLHRRVTIDNVGGITTTLAGQRIPTTIEDLRYMIDHCTRWGEESTRRLHSRLCAEPTSEEVST